MVRGVRTATLILFTLGSSAAYAVGTAKTRTALRHEFSDSNSLLGSYLAGRVARGARDSENAAYYYQRALTKDPTNRDILDETFSLELAAGNFDAARQLAQRLTKRQKDNAIAHVFLGLDAFKRKDYAKAEDHFKAAERNSAGEPTVKLARAWGLLGQGNADKAISLLESPSKASWAAHFETVQRAFIADVGKKKAAAEKAFEAVYDKKNTRVAEAYARHLAFWGDKEQAKDGSERKRRSHLANGQGAAGRLGQRKSAKAYGVRASRRGLPKPFSALAKCL